MKDNKFKRGPVGEEPNDVEGIPMSSPIADGIVGWKKGRIDEIHLDDLAESFMMSAFHGGKLKTMKAHYTNDDGDLRVIRPLVYAREKALAEFAQINSLPVIAENCPACFAKPTQREHMKQLLAKEEESNKALFGSLLTTMKPLMAKGLPKK